MEKTNQWKIFIIGILWLGLSFVAILKPDTEESVEERRLLKQMPKITKETFWSGSFMGEFEEYALDQFPFRNQLRSLKARTLLKKDNHDFYVKDGVIISMEYPLQYESLKNAGEKFQNIWKKYLEGADCNVYYSWIPDKNYFFAEETGHLQLDYEELVARMKQEMGSHMKYLDIFPYVEKTSYYNTDIHWRQEALLPVAEFLQKAMIPESTISFRKEDYQMEKVSDKFYGVSYGQAGLALKPDTLFMVKNQKIQELQVYDYENQREIPVYDLEKVKGKDPYEMFLGGSLSLLTLENKKVTSKRNLVLFRDSFGSSLVPLLAQSYEKTTVIDIRYIHPVMLEELVEFQDCDVLFLYSTSVLNHSETLK